MTRKVNPASGWAGWRRGWAVLTGLLALAVAGCGGGGADDAPPAPAPNSVSLQSDSGDYIGLGRSYRYTTADAVMVVSANGGYLQVAITGDKTWHGDFQLPRGLAELRPGSYGGLSRYPFHDPASGGLSWSGDGRGCNTLQGTFTVDSVSYAAGVLTAIDLHFEQHCEGAGPALRGQIHWTASDPTQPAGPASLPATLWQPPAGAMPASGNAVYLQSDAGDYIGQGATRLYTAADSLLSASISGSLLQVGVSGDQGWSGSFQGMNGLAQLQPGYYPGLGRYPFHNPVKGGLSWSGEGRGCNTLTGWFVVDSVSYAGGQLTAIDLRFEQHCEGGSPALRGRIRWVAADTAQPPGPVPPPAGLWSAPAGSTPVSGNYAYLQSDAGDYIGGGQTLAYTQANAVMVVNASGGHFSININGSAQWTGNFQAMQGLAQLQPGYYGSLQRYPFNNPARGGLDWSGDGRGCNTLTGWVVVDSVTYVSGAMTAIDLRFEQHCEGAGAALRGQIHWATGDPTQPAGPVNPPPAGLWQAASGATPASGNYVYLLSDAGDYIGGGGSGLYTAADSALSVSASGGRLTVTVGDGSGWAGTFQTMNSISQLQPGYYGNLQRYPFHNPALGGLSWSGQGRGCNTLAGWFIVDSVSYVGGVLTAISLRFEQHCEGGAPALHGQLRWAAPS